jgi:hypothetical protein
VLAIAWVLAGIAVSVRARRRGTWMRVLLVLSAASTLLVVVMTHAGLILVLPRMYATLQFGFRLESYVLLGVAGAVLAALVLNRDGDRGVRFWIWALVPVLAVSALGAVQQTDAHPAGRSRALALSSYLEPTYEQEGLLDYVDDHVEVTKTHLPLITFPPESVRHDRASILVREPPGQRVDTNIRSAPELIHVSGARVVGADLEADDVLEITAPTYGATRSARRGTTPTERISVTAADSFPIVAGRVLTALALAVLAIELILLATPGNAGGRAKSALSSLTARLIHAKAH